MSDEVTAEIKFKVTDQAPQITDRELLLILWGYLSGMSEPEMTIFDLLSEHLFKGDI